MRLLVSASVKTLKNTCTKSMAAIHAITWYLDVPPARLSIGIQAFLSIKNV